MQIFQDEDVKILKSENVNYIFNKKNGFMATWGKTKDEDPEYSPFGPFLLDIEITDICHGIGNYGPCPWCYKANSPNGSYMTFETFKTIFDKLPKVVTQIAFGVDAKCKTNPDVFQIMKYTYDNGIIPNCTVADCDESTANELAKYCGSVAVSRYWDTDICYNSIQRLADAGQKQLNIHLMISEETLPWIYETFRDYFRDSRLSNNINAFVLLSLKQKGRGADYNILSQDKFKELIDFAMQNEIPIGFDSCAQPKFLDAIHDHPNYSQLEQLSEPCESSRFSYYSNTYGKGFPCSFVEGEGDWKEGIDLTTTDFLRDVWFSDKSKNFRESLKENCNNCPIFDI